MCAAGWNGSWNRPPACSARGPIFLLAASLSRFAAIRLLHEFGHPWLVPVVEDHSFGNPCTVGMELVMSMVIRPSAMGALVMR